MAIQSRQPYIGGHLVPEESKPAGIRCFHKNQEEMWENKEEKNKMSHHITIATWKHKSHHH